VPSATQPTPIAMPPFPALPKIVDEYAKLREFESIPQTEIKAIKNEKRWKVIAVYAMTLDL
jgi:hypothetical protein